MWARIITLISYNIDIFQHPMSCTEGLEELKLKDTEDTIVKHLFELHFEQF